MQAELVRRIGLIEHWYSIVHFSQLHFNSWLLSRPHSFLGTDWVNGGAQMLLLMLRLLSIEPSLSLLPFLPLPLSFRHIFFVVFVQNLLLLQVSNFTHAILRHCSLSILLLSLHSPSPLSSLQLIFLFFDVAHEFFDVFHGIEIDLLVVLAAWTVHKFVLLARKVIDYPLEFRIEITVLPIQLEVL